MPSTASSSSSSGGVVGLVLESTSFYAESGGQTADTGVVAAGAGSFDVEVWRRRWA